MSSRSRLLIISSVILAALVLAGLIMNITSIPAGSPLIFLYVILALISVLSVPLVYWLRIRKSKFEQKLEKDYLGQYEVIKEIIGQSSLPRRIRKEIIDDVLDLLLTAQSSQKPISEVIVNADTFTADIIEAYTQHKPSGWRLLPDCVIYFTAFTLGSHMLNWIEDIHQDWLDTQIPISMVIFIALIAFLLIPVLRLKPLRSKPWIFFLPIFFGLLFILLSELLRRFAMDTAVVKFLHDGDIRMIPNTWILLIMTSVIPLMVLIKVMMKRTCIAT
jgi:DNA-binding ferritin-like protein (Dps family)